MKRIILNSLIIALLTLTYSCNNFGKKGNIDPDDTMHGRKVMEWNADKTPKVVYFYKVDANGNMTNEKIREVYYFPAKRNMSKAILRIIRGRDSGVPTSLTAK